MKTVLHVLSSLKLGGAERFVIDLARLQNEKGMQTSIMSMGADDDILVQEVKAQRIAVNVCNLTLARTAGYLAILKLFLDAQIIHIHSPHALRALAPFVVLFCWKTIIYTRHGLSPLKAEKWRGLHVFLMPFLSQITFVAQAGLDSFASTYGFDSKKLRTIENGVYIPVSHEKQLVGQIRFGSVGRMVSLKGQHYLLRAIKKLELEDNAHSNFCVHFFGAGPEEGRLKELAYSLQGSERFFFHGTVIDREEIYRAIDVLVVCSETEGLSLVIMEAMARGIPVIATNVGGNPILVQNNLTGFLVDFADIAGLKEAICTLLKDPGKALLYGENARSFIESKYSLEHTYAEYLECYSN